MSLRRRQNKNQDKQFEDPVDPFKINWGKFMSALDQRKGVYEPRRETLKDIPLAGTEEDRYRRSELLKKRKARLIEFARRSSDDATVKVCIAYLQTYFGGGRKMIFELCKYRLIWNARGWRLFYDELAERFYPPKTKVYLGRESNERLKKKVEKTF